LNSIKKKINFKNIKWMNNLKKIPKFPSIFIANEFFDALPIKQFLKKNNNWYEKYIINKDKSLNFFEKKIKRDFIEKLIRQKIQRNQKFIEYSPLANEKLNTISKIIKKQTNG